MASKGEVDVFNAKRDLKIYEDFISLRNEATRTERYKVLAEKHNLSPRQIQRVVLKLKETIK
ncbi:MAG: hypothetical protein AAGC43_04570 [Bacteroidota bacterium]